MVRIKVGGVPEHFNLPWHLCIENEAFQQEGLDISWKDFPDGTGAMCSELRTENLDVAVILTEGIIKDIAAGNETKIVQKYIASPLQWGIHVAANSRYETINNLQHTTAAISRYGSGSHLMAYVNAKREGWNPAELDFAPVADTSGAVEALQTEKAAYFMWELFTTKPLVDKGVFRRIGVCPTPWPCFVIAVRSEFLKKNPAAVDEMLQVLNRTTADFKQLPNVEKLLAERYDQKEEDIEEWLKQTFWSQEQISEAEIEKVQEQLEVLDLISGKKEIELFVNNFKE